MLDVIIVGLTSIVSIILLTAMCCKGNGKVKTGEDKVENSGSFTLGSIGNHLIIHAIMLDISKFYPNVILNLEPKHESGNDYDEISVADSHNDETIDNNDVIVDTTVHNDQSEHMNPIISNIYYDVESEVNNANIRDNPTGMERITITSNPYYAM